jgi:hypothetical protein
MKKRIGNRNQAGIFFKISGFLPEEIDDIIYRQKAVKQALKDKKSRLRIEKQQINLNKHRKKLTLNENIAKNHILLRKNKSTKAEKQAEQIQNGYNLAVKWAREAKERQIKKGSVDVETRMVGISNDPEPGLSEAYTDCFTYINLNITKIIKEAKITGVTFNHWFENCVSHEYIHCILAKYINYDAAITFDNICAIKQVNLLGKVMRKKWRGGLPWWE